MDDSKLVFNVLSTLVGLLFCLDSFALTHSAAATDDQLQPVVLIRTTGKDPNDGSLSPAYCNATLLKSDLLVTAAHCLRDASLLKDSSIQIEVGKYKYTKRKDGSTARIGYAAYLRTELKAEFSFLPSTQRKIDQEQFTAEILPEEDLAIAHLNQPLLLPENFPFTKIPTAMELRDFRNRPVSFAPIVVTINPTSYVNSNDTKQMAQLNDLNYDNSGYFESESTARVEPGDSGAPFLVNFAGQWKIVGVVKGQASNLFGDWDVITSIDRICYISRALCQP